ncbi:hypothetical protein G6F37_011537 [Rhizopus arrhizus]|nr:hypothetical protein G6F38_009605 [Rhizopus arrhizus]KAG1148831.1 hypothetical protein G6F37_011537 [Rhizopus arrhizus]
MNQEVRGDDVGILDSAKNTEPHSYNPYYTDKDESYILPENLFDIRRLSDSSSDRNLEEHDQYGGALTEEMLRCTCEDLNQMNDQKRRTSRDDNLSNLLIDPSHSDGMYLKTFCVLKAVCPTKQLSNQYGM